MRFLSLVVVSGAAVLATRIQPHCVDDDCAREVAAHETDCSSLFRFTVTPATYTSTATVTLTQSPITVTTTTVTDVETSTTTTATETVVVTVTELFSSSIVARGLPTPKAAKKKRPCTPVKASTTTRTTTAATSTSLTSSLPTYANRCSGTAAFSSACSCFGVTKTTVTAATPSTTITVTATAATTIDAAATTTVIDDVAATALATATATVFPLPPYCGTEIANGQCQCLFDEYCNYDAGPNYYAASDSPDFVTCINRCDSASECVIAEYDNTGSSTCYLYSEMQPLTPLTSFLVAVKVRESCPDCQTNSTVEKFRKKLRRSE